MKKLGILFLTLVTLCSCSTTKYSKCLYTCFGWYDNNGYHEPLNTQVTLSMYNQKELSKLSSTFESKIDNLHMNFDCYYSYDNINNIYTLNNTNDKTIVSEELFSLIEKGIELTKLSKGKMNIFMGSTIDLWKDLFKKLSNYDPNKEDILSSLETIPSYTEIDKVIALNKEDHSITFNPIINDKYKTTINTGAISKGYAIDLVAKDFENKYAVINAGSSSIRICGDNPLSKNKNFIVNLKEPTFGESTNEAFITISIGKETNISTSGDYEKFFCSLNNGDIRSHIINPDTGYSSSYHAQVCVYSSLDAIILDALSTALMNTESIEECKTVVNDFETYYNGSISYVIIDRNESNIYSVNYKVANEESINIKSSKIISSNKID